MSGAANGNELFERAVMDWPEEPGLLYFDTPMTFRDAAERAWALAASLRELGLRPGDRLALMLQNGPATVIAIHAAWHAGCVATAINPMSKPVEVRHQLADSGARVVICLESLHPVVVEALAGTGAAAETDEAAGAAAKPVVEQIITISELAWLDSMPPALIGSRRRACPGALDLETLCAEPAEPRPATVEIDSPALLAYTSGTTGTPKGAIVTHRAFIHNGEAMTAWGDLGRGDVTIAMAPLFHITGLVCHLATARASATPLLLMHRFEPGEFLRLVERWRGTYVIGPLTAFIALLEHPDFARRDISSLTKVASGGAPVFPAVVERWEGLTGNYVHNTYGLTESAAPSHLVARGERAPVDPESGALSIGRPITDTESKIVLVEEGAGGGGEGAGGGDNQGDPREEVEAGPGELGEIVTRGPAVTPGYWGRPEETAHAIRDGWLHTGDVGRRDADGWFYIVDRIKDMIVVSGYKVWPRDVEDALYAHPAVQEAAVVGEPDDYRGETVVAFVVLRPGEDAGVEELIAHCRERLAVYKAPHVVHLVAELPKTASGKVLRRELRGGAPTVGGARPATGPTPSPGSTSSS
ncbi:MAG: long-chain acyl-CoA synthetase [Solirubrobacterales bacterium]|nr:long-chain acyl-CoA synthetase [Solirubrobacterales bacterium]